MKKLVVLLLLAGMLTGCAGLQLKPEATPEEIRVARCQDAQTGLALADVWATSLEISNEMVKWWIAYRESCKVLIAQYCPGK